MVKILHLADCHLGAPISGLPSGLAFVRRQQFGKAFSDALSYGAENGVNLVLIPGDLFDNENASPSTVAKLNSFAKDNPEIRIFIAPGNHDCIMGNSEYPAINQPNITVFDKGSMESVDIPELNTTVYGMGNLTPHNENRPLQNFYVEDTQRINIMCLHGLINGSVGHTPYNPLTREDIAQSGLDYLALGHVHAFSGINHLGSVYYAYPGCLIGRGFDELGVKGFIAGGIDKDGNTLSFIETKQPFYLNLTVDCTDAMTIDDILDKVEAEVAPIASDTYLRVTLTGRIKSDLVVNRKIVENSLTGFTFAQVKDKTLPMQDYMAMSQEQTLKGMFIRQVLASTDNEEEAQKAISLGLAALCNEEMNMDEY